MSAQTVTIPADGYLATLTREVDGTFVDAKGTTWDHGESAIGIGVLGFCGCGYPVETLKLVRDVLEMIEAMHGDGAWSDRWEAREKREAELFHGDTGLEYLAYYVLSDKELTEHGGSVGGAWLTDLGRKVLVDLRVLLPTSSR